MKPRPSSNFLLIMNLLAQARETTKYGLGRAMKTAGVHMIGRKI